MSGGNNRALGITLFVLIGASSLVLGIMSTQKHIDGPLKVDLAATARLTEALNGSSTSAAIEVLKTQDTDGDGLSDYDEIYTYHTSAYIKDSDSDGIPDGVEIKNGTDPNCPEGKDCGTPAPIYTNTPALGDSNSDASLDAVSGLGIGTGEVPTATVADAAKIRALLKEQGLTDEALGAIDDATLVQMYNDSAKVINDTQKKQNATSTSPSTP